MAPRSSSGQPLVVETRGAQGDGATLLASPPGFVGMIADWVYATAARQSHLQAVAAALVVASAATCNKYRLRSLEPDALNIYLGILAPSGSGKEGYRKAIRRLLRAAECADQILETAASGPALHAALATGANRVLLLDEAGLKLVDSIHSGSDTHGGSLRTLIMQLHNLGRSELGAKVYANGDQNIGPVENPYLNIYFTTTKEPMVEALSSKDLRSGFLNRIVLVFDDAPPPRRPMSLCRAINHEVPDDIRDRLKTLKQPPHDSGLVTFSPEVEDAFDELDAYQADKPALWQRLAQNVQRIAGILAVADGKTEVTIEYWRWAETFVRWCLETTERVGVGSSESPFDADCKKALDFIKNAAKYQSSDSKFAAYREEMARGLMPKAKLTKLLSLPVKRRREVIEHLIDSEEIVEEKPPKKKGMQRPAIFYRPK